MYNDEISIRSPREKDRDDDSDTDNKTIKWVFLHILVPHKMKNISTTISVNTRNQSGESRHSEEEDEEEEEEDDEEQVEHSATVAAIKMTIF